MNILQDPTSHGLPVDNEGNAPGHTFQIRSLLNLTRRLEWDSSIYRVARLSTIPGYLRLDTRLGWRLGESTEISVVGQNLLTPRHAEHPDQWIGHTQVERSVFGKITWRF
jgi:iron complex outermembrane receptor protein